MRFDLIADNPLEWIAKKLNLAPAPLIHTHMGILEARAVMAASKFGVFAALAEGPRSADAVAAVCSIDARAVEKLLGALTACGYFKYRSGTYALTRMSRKWLLPSSPVSLHGKMLFTYDEWTVITHLEAFLTSGASMEVHSSADGELDWGRYQQGMRSLSSVTAQEVAGRLPVPRGAAKMLDIGGSHGFYSVTLCRKYTGLSSVILDLPQAIAHAAPILAQEGMGNRVVHQPGDALATDLGESKYDLVFMSQLVHHFDDHTNRALVARIARALRRGGVFAILDSIRPRTPDESGQFAALMDLYFALTSLSGTWSVAEMQGWQRGAGLEPLSPLWLRTLPNGALLAAKKPA
jgi:SAM-dependent methyltransferase